MQSTWGCRRTRIGAVVMSLSVCARAQMGPSGQPPASGPPSSASAPVGSFPVAPPEATPLPAPSAAPSAPLGAASGPQYGATPPLVYPPPVSTWPRPEPFYPPAPKPEPEVARDLAVRGPYFGAWLGAGGPFGGNTATAPGASFKEGFGFLAEAGYAFIPNFGVNLFLHYNQSSIALSRASSTDGSFDEDSGHVLLYGIEARGIVGSGPLLGWASLGISLGSGSLGVSSTVSNGFQNLTSRDDATIDFNPMPVLGFGAEVRLIDGLAVGPQFRWYVTSAKEACDTPQITGGGQGDPNFVSGKTCTQSFGSVTVPDIVFLGVGVSYRLAL
jgi:hypothetical protein